MYNTKTKRFQFGDIVQYSDYWLEAIQADQELADLQGKIIQVTNNEEYQKVKIHWEDGEINSALSCNLQKYRGCPKLSVVEI